MWHGAVPRAMQGRSLGILWLARHLAALPEAFVAKYGLWMWMSGVYGCGASMAGYGRIGMPLVKGCLPICFNVAARGGPACQRPSHRLAAYLLIAFNLEGPHPQPPTPVHPIEILSEQQGRIPRM